MKHNNISGTDPQQVERLRIALVVCLSKRPAGELVRMIMDWLEDADLVEFCRKNLSNSEKKTLSIS